MRYSVAFFAALFTSCGWVSLATAQVAPSRDSAAYYFRRGNGIHKYEVYGDKQAIADYTKSIAFDSSQYWAYRNRGDCYQNLKDYSSALADYDRAVAIEGTAPASAVRFDCITMCSQLALWSEVAAHCSALLANPFICADTAEIFWHPTACVDTNRITWRILWLQRAEARVKLKQYAARQDYLTYQRRILTELAAEEKFLVRIPHIGYVRGSHSASDKVRRLPRRHRAEVLARQQAVIARLKKKNDAVATKVAELDKLLH